MTYCLRRAGAITAVVDKEALIRSPRYAPLVVLRDIARASSVEEVARRCERTVPLAAGLLGSTSLPRPVNSTLTSVFDAATVRLLELALEDLEAPLRIERTVVEHHRRPQAPGTEQDRRARARQPGNDDDRFFFFFRS